MGKAARKRLRGQSRYLAKISETWPELFAEKWDRRIDSWLREIRLSIAEWEQGGDAANERVFEIVDGALTTLAACGLMMYERYAKQTYDVLCNECCVSAAGVLDPHLYKLSNYKSLEEMTRKQRRSNDSEGI